MALYTKHMHQVATYWAPGGPDGYGGREMLAPVAIACRWQERAVLFRDVDGREVTSSAICYPAVPLEARGYLALGDYSNNSEDDPKVLPDAYEIRQVQQSPNLRATETLYKAYL